MIRSVLIINLEVKDNHEEAATGAKLALDLCQDVSILCTGLHIKWSMHAYVDRYQRCPDVCIFLCWIYSFWSLISSGTLCWERLCKSPFENYPFSHKIFTQVFPCHSYQNKKWTTWILYPLEDKWYIRELILMGCWLPNYFRWGNQYYLSEVTVKSHFTLLISHYIIHFLSENSG